MFLAVVGACWFIAGLLLFDLLVAVVAVVCYAGGAVIAMWTFGLFTRLTPPDV